MADIYDWSLTPATNGAADSDINWSEGMDPDQVNDSARQMMTRVAEVLDDIAPTRTTTGTGNAYAITSAAVSSGSYNDGEIFSFIIDRANTSAATINVNGRGAVALRPEIGREFAAGELRANQPIISFYRSASNEVLAVGSGYHVNALTSGALTQSVVGRLMKVGTPYLSMSATVEAGSIRLTQTTQTLNKADWPELSSWLSGKSYPWGSTSTTFNLPPAAGYFLRFAATSTAIDTSGARTAGSTQSDQNKAHTHGAGTLSGTTAGSTVVYTDTIRSGVQTASSGGAFDANIGETTASRTSSSHTHTFTVTSGATGSSGGDEVRVKNVAFHVDVFASSALATGALAQFGFSYAFDAPTTSSDPGSGNVRLNNATLASVTEIYISETDSWGVNISGFLSTIENGVRVRLSKIGAQASTVLFTASGAPTDNGGWRTIPGAVTVSGGSFTAGDSMAFEQFSGAAGDAGDGDVTGPASSVDSELALFSSTSGKELKRASFTGLVKATSGVASAATAGTDYTLPSTLAATSTGAGAALVGIEDSGSYFSGSTVESALAYLGAAVAAHDQAVILKGTWDASAGTFPGSGSAQAGWSYIVSVAGTVDSVAFTVGDRVISVADNASTSTYASNWFKADYTDQVSSVFSRTGAVTAQSGDYTADQITNTPSGNLSSVTVQAAINELDALITAAATGASPGAADLLDGEEGIAFDFLTRSAVINDYADTLSDTGRPESMLTVTRASTKMCVNRSKLLASVAINTLAYDHDPVTGVPRGVLLEPAATNLLTRSQEFDHADWSKARLSVSANATTAPDGTTTADIIVEDGSASNSHVCYKSYIFSAQTYCLSVWVKASTRSWIFLNASDGTLSHSAFFNVSSGALGTQSNATAKIEQFANSWFRCSITFTAVAGAGDCGLYLASGDASHIYNGDGVSGLYVWGGQLETGAAATSYIPTTSGTVMRSADDVSIATSLFPLNAAQGTLFIENALAVSNWASTENGGGLCLRTTSDDSILAGRYVASPSSSPYIDSTVTVGAVLLADTGNSTTTIGAINRIALCYLANDIAQSINGGAVEADASATIPSVTTLSIGTSAGGNVILPTWIRRCLYISRRMTNAELQSMTA